MSADEDPMRFDVSWRGLLAIAVVAAAFVAACFAPQAACSVRVSDSSTTTTTTEADR